MNTAPAENEKTEPPTATITSSKPPFANMAWLPGGQFLMGSNDHYPEEAPAHKVTVPGFWMDKHVVTNADFRKFVDATGYITMAESAVDPADYPAAAPEMLVPASVVLARQPARSWAIR